MKTILCVFLLAVHTTAALAANFVEVTSVPVEMIRAGKTDLQILATPPPGMRIAKVIIVLEPIPVPMSQTLFESTRPKTNSVPARPIETPRLEKKEPPASAKGIFRHLSLEKPRPVGMNEKHPLFSLTYKF